MLIPLLLATAVAGDCPVPTSLAGFQQAVSDGEAAFAQLDLVGLHSARDVALAELSCLGDRVLPTDAAAFHRLMGMVAFTARQRSWVLQEFHAARRLDPGYRFPPEVAQPGHPLIALYDEAIDASEGPLERVAAPADGYVVIDGVRDAPRPTDISAILQVYGPPDVLAESLYLLPGDATPHWGEPPVDWTRRRHRWLGAGAGVATGLSALFYGAVLIQRGMYFDLDTPRTETELAVLRTRINAADVAGLGTGVVALGLGTALVWTW